MLRTPMRSHAYGERRRSARFLIRFVAVDSMAWLRLSSCCPDPCLCEHPHICLTPFSNTRRMFSHISNFQLQRQVLPYELTRTIAFVPSCCSDLCEPCVLQVRAKVFSHSQVSSICVLQSRVGINCGCQFVRRRCKKPSIIVRTADANDSANFQNSNKLPKSVQWMFQMFQ